MLNIVIIEKNVYANLEAGYESKSCKFFNQENRGSDVFYIITRHKGVRFLTERMLFLF